MIRKKNRARHSKGGGFLCGAFWSRQSERYLDLFPPDGGVAVGPGDDCLRSSILNTPSIFIVTDENVVYRLGNETWDKEMNETTL